MARVRRPTLAAIVLPATLLITACAGSGGGRDLETTEPGTLPSDYDPTAPKDAPASSGEDGEFDLLSLFFGTDEEATPTENGTAEARTLRQEVARLRADLRARDSASPRGTADRRSGPGIALVFPNAGDAAATRAYAAMARVATEYPLTPVSPSRLEQALAGDDCSLSRLADCGRGISAASGARLAALISGTEPANGRLPLSVTLVDMDLGVRYPAFRIELPASGQGTAEESLAALADAVYLHALERLRLAARIYHTAGRQGDRWALPTPGARFDAGTRFTVHPGGRVIRQGGEAIAWIPDETSAVLEATGRTANGLLLLRRVEGRAPQATDLVLPPAE